MLGLPRVISVTDEPNVRSLAVMRRLGLTFLEHDRITDNGETFDVLVHAITAAAWRADRGAGGSQRPRWSAATRLGTTIRHASVTSSASSPASISVSRTHTQL